nr:hypothetical protein [uncultured Flavobacterium sp.]
MKTVIGIGLIILGLVSLFRYPNIGDDGAETFGVFLGIGLFTFLPGILLVKSDNKNNQK